MSLRDYFAGQALPSVVADLAAFNNENELTEGDKRFCGPKEMAVWAYGIADAMLAERAKTKETP